MTNNITMGQTSSNKTSNTLINLALAAFYLNLTIKTANGSQFYEVGPVMPIALPAFEVPLPLPAPDSFGRYAQAGAQGYNGYGDLYKGAGGYRGNNGFYDDLLSTKNAYDIGTAHGGGQDYSKGSVAGGGFRDLNGRNKGHQAAGFSTSYRKDESGDQSVYYDDGLGHNARINYAAQDARLRDQGGAAKRGGYHDTNLNRNAVGNTGRYGDAQTYKGYSSAGGGYTGGNGYGSDKSSYSYYPSNKGYSYYPTTKGSSYFPSFNKAYSTYPAGSSYSNYQGGKGFSSYPYHDYTSRGLYGHGSPTSSILNDYHFSKELPGTAIKDKGLYVIPMPEKLYFDTTPAVQLIKK